MMHTLFILYVLIFICYVLLKRRPLDFLTFYGAFLILFSFPTIFGVVYNPYSKLMVAVYDEVYFISSLNFICLTIVMICKDLVYKKPVLQFIKTSDYEYNNFLMIGAVIISLLSFIVLPGLIGSNSKVEVLESVSYTYLVLSSLIPVLFLFSFMNSKNMYTTFFFIILIALFLLGSRRPLTLAFIGVLFISFYDYKFVLISKWKLILVTGAGLCLVILGKSFYGYFLVFGVDGILMWGKDLNIDMFLSGAEFISTSAILNEVVSVDFKIPFEDVPYSFAGLLPVPVSIFGLTSSSFNDQFQPVLFQGISYGMAYNPWAEAYAWLGYGGVFMYSVFIPSSLVLIERLAHHYRGHPLGAIFIVIGALMCFWIHRNSLGSEFAYIRNAFYPSLFIFILSITIRLPNISFKSVRKF